MGAHTLISTLNDSETSSQVLYLSEAVVHSCRCTALGQHVDAGFRISLCIGLTLHVEL